MSQPFPSLPFSLDEAPAASQTHRRTDSAMDSSDVASLSTFTSALERLEELVREETEALRRGANIDFAEISRRKSRSLLELTRIARAVPPRLDPTTATRVRALRDSLQQNLDLLSLHLSAAQEVSSIMHSAIREAESDGTYSTSMAYGKSFL